MVRQGLLAAGAAVAMMLMLSPSAWADSAVNVTTTSDAPSAGQCSLREAVTYANGTPEGDCAPGTASGTTTINIPAGTYTLSGTGLSLSRNAVLNGAGAASTTVSGGNAVQVLNIAASTQVTINGVTITKGMAGNSAANSCSSFFIACAAGPGTNGGGIANAGSLTLVNSAVSGNAAGPGFTQTFGLVLCGFPPFGDCSSRSGGTGGNGGNGGGIYNNGQLTIQDSVISGNNAGAGSAGGPGATGTGSNAGAGSAGGSGGIGGEGGGILNDSAGTATIVNSTITGNSAGAGGAGGTGSDANAGNSNGGSGGFAGSGGIGGGIVDFGALTMTSSTLSANATGQGGTGGAGGHPSGTGSNGTGRQGGFAGSGGGLYANAASASTILTDDTINGNTTAIGGTGPGGNGGGGDGGAIWHFGALVQLSFVTIANNSAAHSTGGIANTFGTITEANSIIAANTAAPAQPLNCTTNQITDEGNNVVFGDNSCPGTNGDPKLGALSLVNGGPTATMALRPGSAAIDRVPIMQCPVTTDQRGVARPQGVACDAGAYEVAPPAIASPSGTGTSPSTGSVTASINPDFSAQDTTVSVKYGTTTAYGSTTPQQDIGAGGRPVSFSANIGGLSAGTTYHFQIVATNGDGTAVSADGTFRTGVPNSVSISAGKSSGPVLSLTIACNGGSPGSRCSGPITLTSHVTTQGKSIVAVTAAKKRPKPTKKPKKVTKRVTVGHGSYSVATGKHTTVRIKLNSTGLKLLAARYKLPVTVSLGGTTRTSKTMTLSYGRLHVSPVFEWAFSKTFAFATQLTINSVPKGAHVALVCNGHGCPFSRHTFATSKRGKLQMASALKQRRLGVGSKVDVQITATNDIGEVVRFTVVSGKLPKESFLCLPPGARAPSACVS